MSDIEFEWLDRLAGYGVKEISFGAEAPTELLDRLAAFPGSERTKQLAIISGEWRMIEAVVASHGGVRLMAQRDRKASVQDLASEVGQ